MSELPKERLAAAAAVRTANVVPVIFEQFGGRDADPEDAYLGGVEASDIRLSAKKQALDRLLSGDGQKQRR